MAALKWISGDNLPARLFRRGGSCWHTRRHSPGGAALNAGQVFAVRLARFIVARKSGILMEI